MILILIFILVHLVPWYLKCPINVGRDAKDPEATTSLNFTIQIVLRIVSRMNQEADFY